MTKRVRTHQIRVIRGHLAALDLMRSELEPGIGLDRVNARIAELEAIYNSLRKGKGA